MDNNGRRCRLRMERKSQCLLALHKAVRDVGIQNKDYMLFMALHLRASATSSGMRTGDSHVTL